MAVGTVGRGEPAGRREWLALVPGAAIFSPPLRCLAVLRCERQADKGGEMPSASWQPEFREPVKQGRAAGTASTVPVRLYRRYSSLLVPHCD